MKKGDINHLFGSLEHVAGALRKSPTMEEYGIYNEEHPELKLAHHKTIAHHLGGWNNAKKNFD